MKIILRSLLMVFSLFGSVSLGLSQEAKPPAEIGVVSKKLEKANQDLQRQIQKIRKKLEKQLKKKYPALTTGQLDSLVAAKTDFLSPEVKAEIKELCQESEEIESIKRDIQKSLDVTPPNLDLARELEFSIKELDELKALYQQVKIPDLQTLTSTVASKVKIPDLPVSPKEFAKLKAKSTDLKGLLKQYEKQFEGWGEEFLSRAFDLEQIKQLQDQKSLLDTYKPLVDGYRGQVEGVQTNEFVKDKLEIKAEDLKKIGGESLQKRYDDAVSSVDKFKKKFSEVTEATDLSQRPENPLKELPFHKRLTFGGNFQISRKNPGSIDASAKIGYRLNPKAQLGIGMAYRVSTGEKFSKFDFNNELFSTRLFFDQIIYRSFYTTAVLEWNRTVQKDSGENGPAQQWVQSGLIGLGKEISLYKKLTGSMSVLYNLIHNENSPYKSPWVFRVGFHF